MLTGGKPAGWRGLKIAFAALGHHGLGRAAGHVMSRGRRTFPSGRSSSTTKWVSLIQSAASVTADGLIRRQLWRVKFATSVFQRRSAPASLARQNALQFIFNDHREMQSRDVPSDLGDFTFIQAGNVTGENWRWRRQKLFQPLQIARRADVFEAVNDPVLTEHREICLFMRRAIVWLTTHPA